MTLEKILTELAVKMTGKTPTEQSLEGILQFIVDNYEGVAAASAAVQTPYKRAVKNYTQQ